MRSTRVLTQCARALRASLQPTTRSPTPSTRQLPAALLSQARPLHTTPLLFKSNIPSKGKSPIANDTDSQSKGTHFAELDVLGSAPVPSTSVDICMHDGFALNSGVTIQGGDGAMLVNGEAFSWRPWEVRGEKRLVNGKGQIEIPKEAFGVLDVIWPRPDLLIVGVGKEIRPLSPATRKIIAELGLRVDVLDTRNAASQFNMLASERGVWDIAAALIPMGWEEGVGAV